ncbi:MAG TPA: hypothetical protein VGB42_05625 [Candidatus Thermoplasmatota archaeon]
MLVDEVSAVSMTPAWEVPASMWLDEDKAIEAFRPGNGFPWDEHDERLFRGVAAFYRNAYRGQLVQSGLPALDGVEARIEAGAMVADVGCGHGHSTILDPATVLRAHVDDNPAIQVGVVPEAAVEAVRSRPRFDVVVPRVTVPHSQRAGVVHAEVVVQLGPIKRSEMLPFSYARDGLLPPVPAAAWVHAFFGWP